MPTEPMISRRLFYGLVSIVAGVAILYFGREILLPLAIAVLVTFLLSPMCTWLERRGVWRVAAVLMTISAVGSLVVVIGWIVGLQMADMATHLPTYKDNLVAKLRSIRPSEGTFSQWRHAFSEVQGAMKGEEEGDSPDAQQPPSSATKNGPPTANRPPPRTPKPSSVGEGVDRLVDQAEQVVPVRVVPDEAVPFDALRTVLTTVMAPIAQMAIIFVLVVFMLMNREDLRNRLVRLAGNRLTLTTRTLDAVGSRISRYLLMNALVNGGYGVVIAIGLKLIGVDYALTWGLLAATLRFIPYIGPITATVLPVGMAFIQFPGNDWMHPLMALGLFLAAELICNNIVEPLAYGHGTGVSTVAILVAAVFWGWVWGPVGLMLSVPITVVLAVLGEHVPTLEPLGILLGDRPALDTWITYYQRLLAGDVDEAYSIVEEQRRTHSLETIYDEVIIRALVMTEKDHDSGELPDEDRQFIWTSTRELLEEQEEEAAASAAIVRVDASEETPPEPTAGRDRSDEPPLPKVLGLALEDKADELALTMLKHLTEGSVEEFETVSAGTLTADIIAAVEREKPDTIVISSVAPSGGSASRYLCKRLRRHFPDVRMIVGRWGCTSDKAETSERLKAAGASATAMTLAEGRAALLASPETASASRPRIAATA